MLAVFQFDSAAVSLLDSMVAGGHLPVLAELKRKGQWQPIDAKATILQSATYPTLCTGIDVREHGLYSAFPWSAADQRARFAHAFERPATIWERLNGCGCRSLVVDPYLAWPPAHIDGVFLSGWHFQDRMVLQRRSVPGHLYGALAGRHGQPPRLDDVYGVPSAASLETLRDHLTRAPGRTAGAVLDLLRRDTFDFLWINFSVAHKGGHHLWDPSAVVADHERPAADRLRSGLQEVYRAIDRALGRIAEQLPAGSDIIVFSPTGMDANTSRADLLPAMVDAVLAPERAPTSASSSAPVWTLRSSIPTAWRSRIARVLPDGVVADLTSRLYTNRGWSRTKAFAVPGENKGYVRINMKGREKCGIVEPAEADALMHEIAEGLTTFQEDDGSQTVSAVKRITDITQEKSSDRLPDLVVFWNDRPAAPVRRVRSPRFGEIVRRGVGSGRSGNHTDEAWALLLPGRRRVRHINRPVRITDIGATACGLFGADMTGLSGTPLLESA